MKFEVPLRELAAARLFASDDECRMVINSVRIEAVNGVMLVIATDGRRLAVIKSEAKPEQDGAVVIPTIALDRLWTLCDCWVDGKEVSVGKDTPIRIETSEDGTRLFVNVVGDDLLLSVPVHPGDYPKWRAVVPKGERLPVPEVCVNPRLLFAFAQVSEKLGGQLSGVRCFGDGTSASPLEVYLAGLSNFYGLVMGCRWDSHSCIRPEWVKAEQVPA